MATFTDTWNAAFTAAPANSQARAQGAARIRETRRGAYERLLLDHFWAGDANDGKHRQGTAVAYWQTTAPTKHASGSGPDLGDSLGNDTRSNGKFWVHSTGYGIRIWTGAAWSAPRIQGLGSTDLEAWASGYAVIEGYRSALVLETGDEGIFLLSNAYNDGGWKYKSAGTAAYLKVENGYVYIATAPSGAADADITWVSAGKKVSGYIYSTAVTENEIFDAIAPAIPTTGDEIVVSGSVASDNSHITTVVSRVVRTSSSRVTFYGTYIVGDDPPGFYEGPPGITTLPIDNGGSSTYSYVSIAW